MLELTVLLLLGCLLGMAKVTGPLFSVGARGKFAGALVYSFWKGINVVREYVIPANPQSEDQGDRRVMLGGLGRSVKYVQKDSDFHGYALAVTPGGQSWISTYVKHIMDTIFTNGTAFDASHDASDAHGATLDFITRAGEVGLTHFDLDYKGMTNQFTKGHQLYCVAKYGCDQYLLDNTKFNISPYTVAFADWVDAEIVEMVADFAA